MVPLKLLDLLSTTSAWTRRTNCGAQPTPKVPNATTIQRRMRHAQPLMLPGCHAHVLKKYRVHICSAWLLENAGAMCAEGKGPGRRLRDGGAPPRTNELLVNAEDTIDDRLPAPPMLASRSAPAAACTACACACACGMCMRMCMSMYQCTNQEERFNAAPLLTTTKKQLQGPPQRSKQ